GVRPDGGHAARLRARFRGGVGRVGRVCAGERAGDACAPAVAELPLAAVRPASPPVIALAPVDDDRHVRVVLVVLDQLLVQRVLELRRNHAVDHGSKHTEVRAKCGWTRLRGRYSSASGTSRKCDARHVDTKGSVGDAPTARTAVPATTAAARLVTAGSVTATTVPSEAGTVSPSSVNSASPASTRESSCWPARPLV